MQSFPGLRVEGGPYTPPVAVQYTIRAVRAAQVGVGAFFLFGEQLFGKLGRPPPTLKILLDEGEIRPLIAEALLATADRINDGLPVDAHKSVAPVQRKRAMQLMG